MLLMSGCVERELTINTVPQDAQIFLNDEEIGISPVTVNFNWYGIYRVKIQKNGYETLKSNVKIERPVHDYFPFDIFENLFNPHRVDSYCWEFDLQPYQSIDRKLLIDKAKLAKEKVDIELDEAREKFEKLTK